MLRSQSSILVSLLFFERKSLPVHFALLSNEYFVNTRSVHTPSAKTLLAASFSVLQLEHNYQPHSRIVGATSLFCCRSAPNTQRIPKYLYTSLYSDSYVFISM